MPCVLPCVLVFIFIWFSMLCLRSEVLLAACVSLRHARLPRQAVLSAHVTFAPRARLRQYFLCTLRSQRIIVFMNASNTLVPQCTTRAGRHECVRIHIHAIIYKTPSMTVVVPVLLSLKSGRMLLIGHTGSYPINQLKVHLDQFSMQ